MEIANFPGTYLQLNAWLASLGVEAIFDVSFGAELTVKSYVEYLKENKNKTAIASPCPAIVTYITLYQPELVEYLVPYDSPMLHVIKMYKKYYPEYKNHKIAVLSPCTAKKREFELVGHGDYNVGFISLANYLEKNNINLTDYPEKEFDNPSAERAVLFSSPGGLIETAERWLPGIRAQSRKIESVNTIYPYLEKLPKMIKEQKAPLIIDCLNCENGCNAGPLTLNNEKSIDEVEYWINLRNKQIREKYKNENNKTDIKLIEDTINAYWTPDLYKRKIEPLNENNSIETPNDSVISEIFITMHKYSKDDIYNCSACGYGTCKDMAKAIYNNLNRPENCHFYLSEETKIVHNKIFQAQKELEKLNTELEQKVKLRTVNLHNALEEVNAVNEQLESKQRQTLIINKEILKQRDNVTKQRDKIGEQSKKIQHSIIYAKRIQDAVLNPENRPSVHDYFVFFKPKDIVIGDFYWFKKIDNYSIIVAADCTGHGVPGAFMSLLGISLLNEITNSQYRKMERFNFTASQILDELKINIIKLLGQESSKNSAKDGIDLALAILNTKTNILQYSGAYNSLLLVQNNQMLIIKADKMPVGIHYFNIQTEPFTNHRLQLQKNDIFYIFSDGYYDQFGGKDYQKFQRRRFQKLLFEIHKNSMQEQKKIINDTIIKHMRNNSQTDDMLVIGIKV